MKGWVYVISDKSRPGLVKVGYSERDPKVRALEMENEGAPAPFSVEYEILVDEPARLEKRVHRALQESHYGKEWFRCSIEKAVAVIRRSAGGEVLHEQFHAIDRRVVKELEVVEGMRSAEAERQRKEEESFSAQLRAVESESRSDLNNARKAGLKVLLSSLALGPIAAFGAYIVLLMITDARLSNDASIGLFVVLVVGFTSWFGVLGSRRRAELERGASLTRQIQIDRLNSQRSSKQVVDGRW